MKERAEVLPDARMDEIAGLAARVSGMPIAVITRREGGHSWVAAEAGLPEARGKAVIAPFVRDVDVAGVEEVRDMTADPRLKDNPYVTGPAALRFFVAAPLIAEEGPPLGVLCVLDRRPRPEGLTADQLAMLDVLARHAAQTLEMRRRAIEAERRQSTLFSLVAKAPIGVVQKELDGRITFINAEYAELLGRSRDALIGHSVREFLHPDDREPHIDAVNAAIAGDANVQLEERYVGPDGRIVWASNSISITRDAEGRPLSLVAVARDITERIRATEALELLANELSHRIKNIFAVVGGLVSLTARGDEAAGPFAQAFRERLNALSLAHEYVRPHSLDAGAPVGDGQSVFGLLRTLMSPYVDAEGDRFVFEGEDAAIGPKSATALALVLHEQATNAVKYGALANERGRVIITGGADGADYVLVWREEDGPKLAGPPARRGFGTDMAARSAAGQLGGRIEHVWKAEGLSMRLVVPRENLPR